jgi:hypothetical protein
MKPAQLTDFIETIDAPATPAGRHRNHRRTRDPLLQISPESLWRTFDPTSNRSRVGIAQGVDEGVLSSLSEGSLGSSVAGRAALVDARQYLGGMEGPVPPPLAAPVWVSFCVVLVGRLFGCTVPRGPMCSHC